jgi:transcriptional regulator with XRE-family HTH domain
MGLILHTWRKRRRLTLHELGRRSGVSYVTIARIEGGKMSPTVTTLEKLAAALRVSLRDLFSGEQARRKPTTKMRKQR